MTNQGEMLEPIEDFNFKDLSEETSSEYTDTSEKKVQSLPTMLELTAAVAEAAQSEEAMSMLHAQAHDQDPYVMPPQSYNHDGFYYSGYPEQSCHSSAFASYINQTNHNNGLGTAMELESLNLLPTFILQNQIDPPSRFSDICGTPGECSFSTVFPSLHGYDVHKEAESTFMRQNTGFYDHYLPNPSLLGMQVHNIFEDVHVDSGCGPSSQVLQYGSIFSNTILTTAGLQTNTLPQPLPISFSSSNSTPSVITMSSDSSKWLPARNGGARLQGQTPQVPVSVEEIRRKEHNLVPEAYSPDPRNLISSRQVPGVGFIREPTVEVLPEDTVSPSMSLDVPEQNFQQELSPTSVGLPHSDCDTHSPNNGKRRLIKPSNVSIRKSRRPITSKVNKEEENLEHHNPETTNSIAPAEVSTPGADLCRFRAARGFATHPRSIAERVRRSRIAEQVRKLQSHLPKSSKLKGNRRVKTVEMLDEVCKYVNWLQETIEKLYAEKKKEIGKMPIYESKLPL